MRTSRFAGLLVATMVLAFAAEAPPLILSHSWIVVTTGAPERKALEKAGFRIAPTVNRHDGQGTASVTVEFLNGFLELIYPDPAVPVSPASQAGAEKFRRKSAWRETGYSPIGVVFDRSPATPEKFPFATWRVSADWMEKGTFIEMMTPKEMPRAVSLSISSQPASTRETENEMLARDPVKGAMFLHPNGAAALDGTARRGARRGRFSACRVLHNRPWPREVRCGQPLAARSDARRRQAGRHQEPRAGSSADHSLLKTRPRSVRPAARGIACTFDPNLTPLD
jgi:hypothetical protein